MLSSLLVPFALSGTQGLEPLDAERIRAELAALAARYASAQLLELGESQAGLPLVGLSVGGPELPDPAPTLLIVGGLEGPRAFSSSLVLDHARRLCETADPLTERMRVVCVPRVALDAAESRFGSPLAQTWASFHDADADRDGLFGEDPPADVDGDGVIAWMRVPDPEGQHLADPHDPRANAEPDPDLGTRGAFRVVREGFDADGDGTASEDGPYEGRVDRGWTAGWQEHEPHAARFPLEDPGARALADFVVEHPEVSVVLAYGDADNLGATPAAAKSGGGRVPNAGWMEDDVAWLGRLGETWRERLEDDALPKPSAHAPDPGSFVSWAYEHRGLWVLAARPWDLPGEAPKVEEPEDPAPAASEFDEEGEEPPSATADEPDEEGPAEDPEIPGEPSAEAGELEWIDATGETWRFLPWTPFDHPQLGPVEIGGFAPFARFDPPSSERAAIADARFAFLTELTEWLPRLAISNLEAKTLGEGLFEVRASVANQGRLPLIPAAGDRANHRPRVIVELSLPDGTSLVAGDLRTTFENLEGDGSLREFVWWIAGDSAEGITLTAAAPHLGTVTQEVAP